VAANSNLVTGAFGTGRPGQVAPSRLLGVQAQAFASNVIPFVTPQISGVSGIAHAGPVAITHFSINGASGVAQAGLVIGNPAAAPIGTMAFGQIGSILTPRTSTAFDPRYIAQSGPWPRIMVA
jgi:hypothetical protein